MGFLILLAVVIGAFSLLLTSSATAGVWGIGLAACLLILARIAQAGNQHEELLATLIRRRDDEQRGGKPPKPPAPEPAITPENIEQIARRYGITEKN